MFAGGSQGGDPVRPNGPSWEERWRAIVGDEEFAPAPGPSPPVPRRGASAASSVAGATPRGRAGRGGGAGGARAGRAARQLPQPPLRRVQSAGSGLPPAVQEDLEDYFDRLDAARHHGAGADDGPAAAPEEAVSVARFTSHDFERLLAFSRASAVPGPPPRSHSGLAAAPAVRAPPARGSAAAPGGAVRSLAACGAGAAGSLAVCGASAAASADDGSECNICLDSLGRGARDVVAVPCPARHRFHKRCLRNWLARSVHCPVCRADVLAALPEEAPAPQPQPRVRRGRSAPPPPGGDGGARTRAGGRVVRFEADPPAEWPRPAYIPAHLAHLAQYLEVAYAGQGSARIWRVPRAAQADLAGALPSPSP